MVKLMMHYKACFSIEVVAGSTSLRKSFILSHYMVESMQISIHMSEHDQTVCNSISSTLPSCSTFQIIGNVLLPYLSAPIKYLVPASIRIIIFCFFRKYINPNEVAITLEHFTIKKMEGRSTKVNVLCWMSCYNIASFNQSSNSSAIEQQEGDPISVRNWSCKEMSAVLLKQLHTTVLLFSNLQRWSYTWLGMYQRVEKTWFIMDYLLWNSFDEAARSQQSIDESRI